MLEPWLRPTLERWVIADLVKALSTIEGITPLTLTAIAAISGLGVCVSLWAGFFKLALGLLILSGVCDILDGALARYDHVASPSGAVMDILSDRFVEWMVIAGLYAIAPQERATLCLLMLGAVLMCVTSFLVVGIFSHNDSDKSFHYSPGLIERPEAFLFFGAMILWPAHFSLLALLFTALVLWTTIDRLRQFWVQDREGHTQRA